jgi:hypothetical protein
MRSLTLSFWFFLSRKRTKASAAIADEASSSALTEVQNVLKFYRDCLVLRNNKKGAKPEDPAPFNILSS